MTKPLSVADIDQLRRLLKKVTKPAPLTPAQCNAKKCAERAAYKAAVLAYGQQRWDKRYAALKSQFPTCYPELGLGERPTAYCSRLVSLYQRRSSVRVDSII